MAQAVFRYRRWPRGNASCFPVKAVAPRWCKLVSGTGGGGALGASLGSLGGLFGTSWAPLGCLLAASGLPGPLLALLAPFLACSWKTLGPPLAALGPLLGRSWAAPGLSWPALGPSWASLETFWAALGSEEQIFTKTLIRPVFYRSELASRVPRWPQVGPNLARVGPKLARESPTKRENTAKSTRKATN